LPLVVSISYKRSANFDVDMSEEFVAEMALYLLSYAPTLMEKPFDAGTQIIKYIQIKFNREAHTKYDSLFSKFISASVNPLVSEERTPDENLERSERKAFLKQYVHDTMRLTGLMQRHAVDVLNYGKKTLKGVTTTKRERFILDYIKVQARIADRVYHGTT